MLQPRLTNSETLFNLENLLSHLSTFQQRELIKVIQENNSVVEKEALALIWALQYFDVYVGGGAQIVIYSDRNPSTFVHSLQSPSQRLMRWTLFFATI